jgi:hypothetical protein
MKGLKDDLGSPDYSLLYSTIAYAALDASVPECDGRHTLHCLPWGQPAEVNRLTF